MVKTRPAAGPMPKSRRFYDIAGLGLFFVGAACLLWLTWPQNAPVPNVMERMLRLLAGSGAYVVPVILMFIGSMFLIGYERMSFSHSTYGSLLLFLTFVTWRHVVLPVDSPHVPSFGKVGPGGVDAPDPAWLEAHVMQAGGYIGAVLGTALLKLFGSGATYIFLLMTTCMSVVLIVDRPFIEILRRFRQPAAAGLAAAQKGVAAVRQKREARPERRTALIEDKVEAPARTLESGEKSSRLPVLRRNKTESETNTLSLLPSERPAEPDANQSSASQQQVGADAVFSTVESRPDGTFTLPPLTLLKEAPPPPTKKAQAEVSDKIRILEQTLDQFGIGANVVEIAHGPTVTRYEIQLAPGIKVSKIVSLADNLAMALAAIDVRVEAPIPGKSAIGVEVPNTVPTIVTLRECLSTPEFQNAPGKLTFALGKDVAGVHKYTDLAKMPHLLIGGATNSGKSVCLNALIASILYRATPEEVKFIMIDPKRVELSLWDGIPHLMHPVVKDVKQAAGIFRSALKEMERRYDLFSRMGTRNIDGYNQRVAKEERLPYVVVVVDELADLMMQAAAEIETSICRLAQLARATGIHLVIATQRPSVDVITGTIKANISSRIAFAVSSQIDSRTILDMTGAERLIGRGDMLFLPIDATKPVRIQGCYLSEAETNALVAFMKEQAHPNYTLTIADTNMGEVGAGFDEDEEEDELFEAAVKLVVTNGQASTSMLQRRFKIGYTRAARLVDMMEDRGIVGPLDGAKPREILVTRDEVERMFREETL